MSALQPIEVVRQLQHSAHQHAECLVSVGDPILEQSLGDPFHFLDGERRALQLDHPQGALNLMQIVRAGAHLSAVGGILDERLERLPRLPEGRVKLGLDPAQGGEVDVVLKPHGYLADSLTLAESQPGDRTARSRTTDPYPGPLPSHDAAPPAVTHLRPQPGSLKSATERLRSAASCARLPIDSAV